MRVPPRDDGLTCGTCLHYTADGHCRIDVDAGRYVDPCPPTYPACFGGYQRIPAMFGGASSQREDGR